MTNDLSINPGFQPANGHWPFISQSDGKILARGTSIAGGPSTNRAFVRLLQDGSVDSTYNSPFVYRTDYSQFTSVALQADGKLLIAGGRGFFDPTRPPDLPKLAPAGIARLNTDGSPDSNFLTTNFVVMEGWAVAALPNAKILLAGERAGGGSARIVRLNSNGSIDTTFIEPEFVGDAISSIAVQPDGKIVIGGQDLSTVNGSEKGNIIRLNENGTLDPDFFALINRFSPVTDLKLQSDGRIVYCVMNKFIARLTSSGLHDPTIQSPHSNENSRYAIDVDANDRIYIPEPQVMRLSGRLRVKVPPATVPIVLERSFLTNPSGGWVPIKTIPADTAADYVDPNYPNDPSFFRTRPAN